MKTASIVLGLLLLASVSAGGYLYYENQKTIKTLQGDLSISRAQAKQTQERLDAQQISFDKVSAELAQASSALSACQSAEVNASTEFRALSETHQRLVTSAAEMQRQIAALRQSEADLQAQLASARTAAEGAALAADKAKQTADALAGLSSCVSRVENLINNDVRKGRDAVRSAENLLSSAPSKEAFAALRESYDNLSRACDRVGPAIEAVEKHVAAHQESLQASASIVVVASKKTSDAKSQVQAMRSSLELSRAAAGQVTPGVYANQDWQQSDLQVDSGYVIAVKASGRWVFAPFNNVSSGPEGVDSNPSYRVKRDALNGALLARVHGSERVAVAMPSFVADRNGRVSFRINDDAVGDNTGTVDVQAFTFRPLD